MAKKKMKHRRRRVGAALNPKSPIVMLAATAVGFLLGDPINNAIDKAVPDGTSKIIPIAKAGAEIGLGTLLLLGKKPSLVKTAIGGVSAGAGIKRLLRKAGIITGYQSVPVLGRSRVGGYQSTPVIGGMPPALSGYRVNGMPAALSGYIPNGSAGRVMGSCGSGSGITNTGGGNLMN